VNRAEIATERLELPEGPSVAPEVAQEPTLEGPARAGLAGGLAFLVALVALAALVVCFLAYSLLSQDNHKPAKPTQEVGVRERDPKPLDKKDPPKPSDDPKKGDPKQADPKKADPKEPSSALVADPKQGATPTPDASAREDAKLELSSDPAGAEVWHKGRSLGVTPLTVTAAQGDAPLVYLLRAKGREARYLVVQPSDLADGQHAEQEALPKLIGGRLSNLEILSTPPGAELYDGDRYVGLTPITLSLPTSRQLVPLRLVLDERTEKTFYFALPSGDHVLKIDLKADQDPIPVPRK
jgi:hypothetical protein